MTLTLNALGSSSDGDKMGKISSPFQGLWTHNIPCTKQNYQIRAERRNINIMRSTLSRDFEPRVTLSLAGRDTVSIVSIKT